MLVFAVLLSFESGRAKMSQKRKPVLLTTALLFAVVLLGLRNNPAGWWITMAALSAGAAFAIYEARQSWVGKSSPREFRLRCTLDFMRFAFTLVCVMGFSGNGYYA